MWGPTQNFGPIGSATFRLLDPYGQTDKQSIYVDFSKLKKNLCTPIFEMLIIHKFPGVTWGPTQNFGPIGSTVLTFIANTNKQT